MLQKFLLALIQNPMNSRVWMIKPRCCSLHLMKYDSKYLSFFFFHSQLVKFWNRDSRDGTPSSHLYGSPNAIQDPKSRMVSLKRQHSQLLHEHTILRGPSRQVHSTPASPPRARRRHELDASIKGLIESGKGWTNDLSVIRCKGL